MQYRNKKQKGATNNSINKVATPLEQKPFNAASALYSSSHWRRHDKVCSCTQKAIGAMMQQILSVCHGAFFNLHFTACIKYKYLMYL